MQQALVIALVVVVIVVVVGGGALLLSSSGALETWQLQAEADRANAQAERLVAQAELTEEQAELETAKGERVLKESQAQVMTSNSETVNGLMSFWGIVGSAVLPIVYGVGAVSGGVCGLLGGYILGANKKKTATAGPASNAPESPFGTGQDAREVVDA